MNTNTASEVFVPVKNDAKTVPVKPVESDRMPYQVATEMLSTPKVKISNAFRKQCQRAREIVLPSTSPILRDEQHKPYSLANQVKQSTDVLLLRRMSKATSPQLNKWLKRCSQRRRNAQDKYYKIKDKEGPRFDKARQLLEMYVQGLDALSEAAEQVLMERTARMNALAETKLK